MGVVSSGPGAGEIAVPVIVMMAGSVAQSILFGVLAPAIPGMALELGSKAAAVVPYILSFPALGLVIAGFTAGPTLDRIGPRYTLIAAISCYMLFGSLPLVTSQPIPLLTARLLLGLACGNIVTASTVLLVACHDGDSRNRMLGLQTAVGSVLGLAAVVLAGALVAHFGWHSVFLLYGTCLAPVLVIALVSVPDMRPAAKRDGGAFRSTITALWPVYIAASLLFVLPVALAGQIAFLMNAAGTHDPFIQSVIMAISSVGSAIAGALFGWVYGAVGPRNSFALSLGLGGVGLIMTGCAQSLTLFGLGSLVCGLSVGLYISYLWLVTSLLASVEMRASALALLSTALYLGGFLYPVVFGLLALPFGAVGGFLAMGGIMIAGAGGALMMRHGRLLLC